MSKINNEDLNEKKEGKEETLSAEDMEQVKGGYVYTKFPTGGVKNLKSGEIKGQGLKIPDISGESSSR